MRVRDELGLADVGSARRHDDDLNRLALPHMGHADDRHLGDDGMALEAVLDLDRVTFSPPVTIASFVRAES